MKHIFISPHADDVALSCGGRIIANAAHGDDTMVVTVFTSDAPDKGRVPDDGGKPFGDLVNALRTLEDKSAWASLAIRAEYLEIPEAVLRRRFPFALLGSGEDDMVVRQLCTALRKYVARYPAATFYFPAGFGNHVDHLACRDAGFRLLDEGVLRSITLYEDVPYCWLRFIRRQYYRVLLRNVTVNKAGLAPAFRPDGLGLMNYWRGRLVPFPRGKKLFAAVWLALLVARFRHRLRGGKRHYRGKFDPRNFAPHIIDRKQRLLGHYASQTAMLFGDQPERLLSDCRGLLAMETMIEIREPFKPVAPRRPGQPGSPRTRR